MNLNEFKTLGNIRVGEHIQVENLYRCLFSDSLVNLNHSSVYEIFQFTLSQLCQTNVLQDLEDQKRIDEVCQTLQGLLNKTKNWENFIKVRIVILFAHAICIANADQEDSQCEEALRIIKASREKLMEFLERTGSIPFENRTEIQTQISEAILESFLYLRLLPKHDMTNDDFECFFSQLVFLSRVQIQMNPCIFRLSLLTFNCRKKLATQTMLTQLLEQHWHLATTQPTIPWKIVEPSNKQRSLTFSSSSKWEQGFSVWYITEWGENTKREIGLNLLTGLILVDGQPVKRLPTTFLQDKSYQMLFQKNVLSVLPGIYSPMFYFILLLL